jgi:hypothetical protein
MGRPTKPLNFMLEVEEKVTMLARARVGVGSRDACTDRAGV